MKYNSGWEVAKISLDIKNVAGLRLLTVMGKVAHVLINLQVLVALFCVTAYG